MTGYHTTTRPEPEHLFETAAVEAATPAGGFTDERVQSVCGNVARFGEFEPVPDPEAWASRDGVCQRCARQVTEASP